MHGEWGPGRPRRGGPLAAIASVAFHLTEGQQMKAVYPADSLDKDELLAVAHHSFPDSMSFEIHSYSSVRDSCFFFRIPRTASTAAHPLSLYGFVMCRQRQDQQLPRGGEQESIVILSPLPLPAVFLPLCKHAAFKFWAYGDRTLRQVWEEAADWPQIEWGGSMTLPLGTSIIRVDLPDLSMLPPDAAAMAATLNGSHALATTLTDELDDATGLPLCLLPQDHPDPVCGPFSDFDAYTPLRAALPQLWALWELLLLGKPLMVASPTPAGCSSAVAALVSLLAPFPQSADFRPFYTVQDPCFNTLAAGALPRWGSDLPSLLGVTNPIFFKALGHWPNVVGSGYTPETQGDTPISSMGEEGGGGEGGLYGAGGGRHGIFSIFRRRLTGTQEMQAAPTDGAWLGYQACMQPDEELLATLVHPSPGDALEKRQRLAGINSRLLRRHFEALARAVLGPLLPYITPTPPPTEVSSPQKFRNPPPLKELDQSELLAAISAKGSPLVSEALACRFPNSRARTQFYRRLLASPSLAAWLLGRRSAAELWQRRAWRQAWRDAGGALRLAGAAHAKELAAVDSYFALEEQAKAAAALGGGGAAAAADALAAALRQAFLRLPEDLRQSLLLTPNRAELLHCEGEGSPLDNDVGSGVDSE